MDNILLNILACPKCQGKLELSPKQDALICRQCQTVYQIIDDIPVLLVEKGLDLEVWEKSGFPDSKNS